MSKHSKAQQLEELRKDIHGSYGFWGAGELHTAVSTALRIAPPEGSPGTLRSIADFYGKVAVSADTARGKIDQAGRSQLPEAWVSSVAAVKASEVIVAAGHSCGRIAEQLDMCRRTLLTLADGIERAKALDSTGRGPLEHAQLQLKHSESSTWGYDGDDVKRAHHDAMAGIDALCGAAKLAKAVGTDAAEALHQGAALAHAAKIASPNLSAADVLVITDAGVPDGPQDANLILTGDQSVRAGDRLDALSADDRARLDALLADAKSPQERAYLLKALAAGYSVGQIEAFDKQIHAHGDDPQWLSDHLTPIVHDGDETQNAHHDMWFDGSKWTQGQHPTCVASSIVTARAQLDPLYSLQLTTGGHPDDPAYDNGDAFAKRLHDEQYRVYDGGRHWWSDVPIVGHDGMSVDEELPQLNAQVGAHSSGEYHNVDMGSASDRQATLPTIERAVDDGKPVVLTVQGKEGGHDMVIVGHDGDMLEIYNPWGYTVWVSEDEFANGQLGQIEDGVPSTPTSVRIPK